MKITLQGVVLALLGVTALAATCGVVYSCYLTLTLGMKDVGDLPGIVALCSLATAFVMGLFGLGWAIEEHKYRFINLWKRNPTLNIGRKRSKIPKAKIHKA